MKTKTLSLPSLSREGESPLVRDKGSQVQILSPRDGGVLQVLGSGCLVLNTRRVVVALALGPASRAARADAVRLTPSVVALDGAFLRSLALEGVGIAILLLDLVEPALAQTRLVRLLSDQESPRRFFLYLLHSATPLVPARVRAFRDFMAHEFLKHDREPGGLEQDRNPVDRGAGDQC